MTATRCRQVRSGGFGGSRRVGAGPGRAARYPGEPRALGIVAPGRPRCPRSGRQQRAVPPARPGRIPALGGVFSIKSQLHPRPLLLQTLPHHPLRAAAAGGLAGEPELGSPVLAGCLQDGAGGTWSRGSICEVSAGLYSPPCGLGAKKDSGKKDSRELLCPCWSPVRACAP